MKFWKCTCDQHIDESSGKLWAERSGRELVLRLGSFSFPVGLQDGSFCADGAKYWHCVCDVILPTLQGQFVCLSFLLLLSHIVCDTVQSG